MTSRTALEYLQTVLDNSWEPDVQGRFNKVPKPYLMLAADGSETRVSQYDGDVIFVKDGGAQQLTPKSVGWTHRETESRATIDIRTQHSRARLEGTRNDDNESEEYGGLKGEVQRILDLIRKGDKEYDLINGFEWNDLSEDVGFQFYRGTFEVRLTQLADEINPPDP